MRAPSAVLVALVATIILVSVAAAGTTPTRQRVTIELSFYPPPSSFAFVPRDAGPLDRDRGRIAQIPEAKGRTVMRGGQRITTRTVTWPLHGRRGSIWVRERTGWVDLGRDGNGDGVRDAVAFGTWTLVRGTGQYAGLTGGGRSAHAGLGDVWHARNDGFLVVR